MKQVYELDVYKLVEEVSVYGMLTKYPINMEINTGSMANETI
jgi:hypothetical protein